MIDGLKAMLPGLVALLLPACESALGTAAPVPAKKAWIHSVVKDIIEDALFSNIPAASWVAQFEKPIETLVLAEVDKLLAGPAPAVAATLPSPAES